MTLPATQFIFLKAIPSVGFVLWIVSQSYKILMHVLEPICEARLMPFLRLFQWNLLLAA